MVSTNNNPGRTSHQLQAAGLDDANLCRRMVWMLKKSIQKTLEQELVKDKLYYLGEAPRPSSGNQSLLELMHLTEWFKMHIHQQGKDPHAFWLTYREDSLYLVTAPR